MISFKYVTVNDRDFWFSLDKHISIIELNKKIRDKKGYVMFLNDKPIGVLRYSLFWDSIPFVNMLYIHNDYQGKGYGKAFCKFFEDDMKALGHGMIMTSTQSDETAIYFYKKIGYYECGYLDFSIEGYEQPREIVLNKKI